MLLVLILCFLIGVAVRTRLGRAVWEGIERTLFEKIPGYRLFGGLGHRLTEEDQDTAWKPALVEIGFVIEELEDGRFTVFVPSVPTPLAGAIHILAPERVHRLDIPFAQDIKTISRWGAGSKSLVAAMERKKIA